MYNINITLNFDKALIEKQHKINIIQPISSKPLRNSNNKF